MIKVEEMKRKFLNKKTKIVPYVESNILDKIKALKGSSKDFPFDLCKFDDEGRCDRFRNGGVQCMCKDCNLFCGFIRFTTEKDLIMYAELYDEKTGFFRKGKGCVLPREYRSGICLSYYCVKDNNFSKQLREYAESIAFLEKEYRVRWK